MSDPITFDGAAASWCGQRRLSDVDARVLAYLCMFAKRGTVIGYNATAAAAAAGFGSRSGPRTFRRSVDRLAAAGAVKVLVSPWGHNSGKLEIVCYEELRSMARASRRARSSILASAAEIPVLARAGDPISRAPSPPGRARDGTRRARTRARSSESRAPGLIPRGPAHGGVLPSGELFSSSASQLHPEKKKKKKQEISQPVEKLMLAITAKSGQVVGAASRLVPALERLASNGTSVEFLLTAIGAAPKHLLPPAIVDEWLPTVVKLGSIPGAPAPEMPPDAEIRSRLARIEGDIHRYQTYGDEPPDYVIRQRDELLHRLGGDGAA